MPITTNGFFHRGSRFSLSASGADGRTGDAVGEFSASLVIGDGMFVTLWHPEHFALLPACSSFAESFVPQYGHAKLIAIDPPHHRPSIMDLEFMISRIVSD